MYYLIVASLFWGFSFGLIKTQLGGLNPNMVALIRTALAVILFFPLLNVRNLNLRQKLHLIWLGVVQYGIPYCLYLYSFRYLKAHQVALFLAFTPIYVTLISDFLDKKFILKNFLAACIAIVGASVIKIEGAEWQGILTGFLILQVADFTFAWGQVGYKKLRCRELRAVKDASIFGLLHIGAFIVALIATVVTGGFSKSLYLTSSQIWTLLYLGICSTGLAYYFWNKGAINTSAGTLAVMNNLKIPIGVAASLLFFGEQTDLVRLTLGGAILAFAWWLSQTENPKDKLKAFSKS